MNKIYTACLRALASKVFFCFVVILFIIQAGWIAFSFRYPIVHDEIFHFPVIKIYSQQISPFITNQPHSYDIHQNLQNGGATVFHYLISYPYRLISVATDNTAKQVIALRVLNITLVAVGLFVYREVFLRMKISKPIVHSGLLLYTLIPLVPFVSATISYDNLQFPLFGWFLLVSLDVLQKKGSDWADWVMLIMVGCFTSLVKLTSLPVFVFAVLYLATTVYRYNSRAPLHEIARSFKKSSYLKRYLLISVTLLFVGMFSARYIKNVIVYHSPQPSCQKTLSLERCKSNSIFRRNYDLMTTVNNRETQNIADYFIRWSRSVLVAGTTGTAANLKDGTVDSGDPVPFIYNFMFFGSILSFGGILYSAKRIFRTSESRMMLLYTLFLTILVFYLNASEYYRLREAVAMSPRYLLPVAPTVIMFAGVSFADIIKHRGLKLAALAVFVAMMTQGGGVTTHIIKSNSSWYWENKKVRDINQDAKQILDPLIKEH